MEKEKKSFIQWVKAHKKELIVTGVSITAITGIILGIKNKEALLQKWAEFKKITQKHSDEFGVISTDVARDSLTNDIAPQIGVQDVPKLTSGISERAPHGVSEHIRNLPEGWKASAEKIATAAEHGYDLQPNQTWVVSYTTGEAAA